MSTKSQEMAVKPVTGNYTGRGRNDCLKELNVVAIWGWDLSVGQGTTFPLPPVSALWDQITLRITRMNLRSLLNRNLNLLLSPATVISLMEIKDSPTINQLVQQTIIKHW